MFEEFDAQNHALQSKIWCALPCVSRVRRIIRKDEESDSSS